MAAGDPISEILSKEGERQLVMLPEKLREAVDEITKFSTLAKGITLEFKGVKDLATFVELQEKSTTTIKKSESAQRAFVDSMELADAVLAKHNGHSREYATVLNTLEKAQLASAKAEDVRARTSERTARQIEADRKREQKAIKELSNDYELLKKAYNEQAAYAKQLGVTLGVSSQQFKDAAASAMAMYSQLIKVETAVGQAQRQVGQYNIATASMTQIMRELPSLANGVPVFLSAIGNNIGGVQDAIASLRKENEALVASGGKAIPIWKTLIGSIFNWQSALLVGITALISYSSRASTAEKATKKLQEANDKYRDSLKSIDESSNASAASEISRLNTLVQTARNTQKSMDERLVAVKELQKLYPEYLGNLTKEKVLTGDIAAELEDLNKAIVARAMMTAVGDKVAKEYEKIIQAEGEINKIREKTRPGVGPNSAPQAFYYDQQERVQRLNDEIAQANENIKQYNNLIDKYAIASGELNKPQRGKQRGLQEFTPDLTGDKMVNDEKARLEDEKLRKIADTQKAIVADEKRSIDERLTANEVYYATLIRMAQVESERKVAAEEQAIRESLRLVADLEKRKADLQAGKGVLNKEQRGKAISDIDLRLEDERKKQDAHHLAMLGAQIKFKTDANKISIDAVREQLSITKTGNEELLKQLEKSHTSERLAETQNYADQMEALRQQLDAKIITQKQYNDKVRGLQQQHRVRELESDKAYYEDLLKNQILSAEQREETQKKLEKTQEDLANARADVGTKKKVNTSGRFTDSIARELAGAEFLKADLDQQQKYYQTFYDNITSIARTAFSAIQQAQQAQVEQEMADLDRKQEGVRASYQFELEVIERSGAAEADKQNMISQLRGQQAASEAQYEAKRRELAQKQARFQRTAALGSAISNTAVAITKALAELGPLAAIAIPLISASGAAQIAAIASAPIPAYKDGTKAGGHKGGPFIAGDGNEPEYIKEPGKPGYWSASKATLYSGKPGTTVTPLHRFTKSVDVSYGYQAGSVTQSVNVNIDYDRIINGINAGYAHHSELLGIVIARNGYRPQKMPDFDRALKRVAKSQGQGL